MKTSLGYKILKTTSFFRLVTVINGIREVMLLQFQNNLFHFVNANTFDYIIGTVTVPLALSIIGFIFTQQFQYKKHWPFWGFIAYTPQVPVASAHILSLFKWPCYFSAEPLKLISKSRADTTIKQSRSSIKTKAHSSRWRLALPWQQSSEV